MKIKTISGVSFMSWDNVSLTLPDTGIVLITGHNGAGKSTIVEAVSQALWGDSLRKAKGWRDGVAGGVEVSDGALTVRRTSTTSGSQKLFWATDSDGSGNYPTKTKAQDKLCEAIGSFDVWSRACAFSSQDAARFTTATDVERKSLLEVLLNLDRFSTGYKSACADRNKAQGEVTKLEGDIKVLLARKDGIRRQIEQAQSVLVDLPDEGKLESLREEAAKLKNIADDCRTDLAVAKNLSSKTGADLADIRAKASISKKNLDRFSGLAGVCPTCEQVVSADHVSDHTDILTDELEALRTMYADVEAVYKQQATDVASKEKLLADAQAAYHACAAQGTAISRDVEKRNSWTGKVDALRDEYATTEKDLDAAMQTVEAARMVAAELDAASAVLGPQGARAGILNAAVASLSARANIWLAKLGLDDLHVEIGSQSATKAGEIRDRIDFAVHGAGGGYGYTASSGGERRRIDIAVMLALGEIANDGAVDDSATMFFDEIFDALDEDGVSAAVSVLEELAETRCVVVISHNKEILPLLPRATHWTVNAGNVTDGRG